MPGLGALWDSLVDCICRPPRDEYIYPDELVGGNRRLFRVGRYPGIREDLTLTNKRGLLLQCSHYFPKHVRGKDGRLPCVIYCHCNSGSRRDAEEAICVLIPSGVSVFTLDFAGSGLSEGQWVTLGADEVDDVATAVQHLRAAGHVSTLGLWGRSMGAVTALLYSHRDPSIAGMVLDSPFARLTDLMLEIVQEQRLPIPRPLAKLALAAMKRSVMKRAGFDITKVSPVDAVSQSHIPALFGHATGDTFIRISHAEALHEAYAGEKELIRFDGNHNSRRPDFFYNSVANFWHRALLLEHLLEPADLSLANPGPAALGLGLVGSSRGGSSARSGAGRPLRPPPPRLRHPQAIPALTAAAGGGTGDGGGGGGAAADGAAAAGDPPPPPSDPAAAASGAGAGEEEEDVADVVGVSNRSAPWEPRLWELDADKAELERQRFRRMAGGLPSPPRAPAAAGGAATAAAGSAADDPGNAGGGGGAGGSGGGSFRNSVELARLFATAGDDESLAVRLLGEDSQWSNVVVPEPRAAGPLGAAAPNGRLAGGLMAAALLLPVTAEEEEEQLRAALELSLLEATNGGPLVAAGAAAAAAGAAPEREPDHRRPGAARPPPLPLTQAGPYRPGSGPSSGATAGLNSVDRERCGSAGAAGGGPSSARTGALLPPLALPPLTPPPALGTVASKPALAASAEPAPPLASSSSLAAAVPAEEAALSCWSHSQEDARVRTPQAVLPSGALSGPQKSGRQLSASEPAVLARPQASAATDAPAASTAAMEVPAVEPHGIVAAAVSSTGVAADAAVSASGVVVAMQAGTGPRAGVGLSGAPPPAAAGASAVFAAAPGGLTVYDLYTEDELLAMAVQLSLQDSAAGVAAGSAPSEAARTAGGAGVGTGEAAVHGLPSLL